jgi:hypothetical protein
MLNYVGLDIKPKYKVVNSVKSGLLLEALVYDVQYTSTLNKDIGVYIYFFLYLKTFRIDG